MSETEVRNVVNVCTNCRFHLRPFDFSTVLPSIRTIGHRLESIHVKYGNQERGYDEFRNAWNGCVNLHRLRIEGCTVEDIKALKSISKRHLETLNIQLHKATKEREVKEIMDICSEACENVEAIAYEGLEPPACCI